MKKTSRIATACVAGALATDCASIRTVRLHGTNRIQPSCWRCRCWVRNASFPNTLPTRYRHPAGKPGPHGHYSVGDAVHDHSIVVQQAMPPQ